MGGLLKVYSILLLLSLLSYVMGRYTLGYFIPFFWLPIGLSALLFVLILFHLREKIVLFFRMKSTHHRVSAGSKLFLIMCFVAFLNFLSVRYNVSYDFSPEQMNSLSVSSFGVLQKLEEQAKIVFFYRQGEQKSQAEKHKFVNLMRKYQDVTSKLEVNFVEVTENPDIAKRFGVDKGAGVVFVEYKGHRSRVDRVAEADVTSALNIVTERGPKEKVYFLTGHGEKEDQDPSSLDGIKSSVYLLEGNGYLLKKLSLITKTRVPEEVKTLFIIGPQESFLEHEVEALIKYVQRGGSLFLALDHTVARGVSSLKPLLNFLGIEYKNHYVIGMTQTSNGWALTPKLTLATAFNSQNPLTSEFKEGEYAVFRTPGSLVIKKAKTNKVKKRVSTLLSTGVDVRALGSLDLKGIQKKGPFSLAMLMKLGKRASKVVVVASSSFMTNQLWSHGVNRDFFLKVTSFLTGSKNQVKVEPPHWRLGRFSLTPDGFNLYALLFAVPLPIVLLGMAIFRYIRRKGI